MNGRRRIFGVVLFICITVLGVFPSFRSAFAAPDDTILIVRNTNDSGNGSLRQAILDSNTSVGTLNTIVFNIPSPGLKTIYIGSSGLGQLPAITDPVIIDGYTQRGSLPATQYAPAILKIELRGNNQPFGAILTISAGNSTVKGLIINNYEGSANGIQLYTGGNNVIQGNYIGLNANGTASLANGFYAIDIINTPYNLIGGTSVQARNVISGSIHLIYNGATQNRIQGNYIGVDSRGAYPLTNSSNKGGGISIYFAPNNIIGGTTGYAGNLIAGSDFFGVAIEGDFATGNRIQGNMIGTNSSGTRLGNSYFGIRVTGAANNVIGGIEVEAGNTIAFASGSGVYVTDRTGNAILSNSIFDNSNLGIELGGDGVSPNDNDDIDIGANNLQNFPVITFAASGSNVVKAKLNSATKTSYHVEIFANTTCDSSGYGEGQSFIGSAEVETNGSGSINFTVPLSQVLSIGQILTATATDPNGNTSEFSQCFAVN